MTRSLCVLFGVFSSVFFLSLSTSAEPDNLRRIERTFNGFDLNSNGKVTREEFLEFWKTGFERSDKNQDGVVDQTEFLHAPNFQARDRNKNGVIELEEELKLRSQHWMSYKLGKQGYLSLDDYVRAARGRPAREKYHFETTFTKMDSNRDGTLTKDEYSAFWEEYFESRDANRDSALNRNEHGHDASFSSFDADRNGLIEKDEEILIREKDFDNLDKDGNGSLVQSEFLR